MGVLDPTEGIRLTKYDHLYINIYVISNRLGYVKTLVRIILFFFNSNYFSKMPYSEQFHTVKLNDTWY